MYHIIGNERGGVSQACVQYQLRRPLAYPNFRVIFIPDRGDHETLLNLSDTRRFPPPPFPFRFEKSSSAPKFLKNFINIIEFIARNDPRSNISNPNSFSNLFSFVCLNTRRLITRVEISLHVPPPISSTRSSFKKLKIGSTKEQVRRFSNCSLRGESKNEQGEIDFENRLDKAAHRAEGGKERCSTRHNAEAGNEFPVKQIQLDRKYQKISRDAFTNGGAVSEIRIRRNIHASPAHTVNFIKGVIPVIPVFLILLNFPFQDVVHPRINVFLLVAYLHPNLKNVFFKKRERN